jgi:hypothetical protein
MLNIAFNKKNIRATIKKRNKTVLSISSKDSEEIALKKVAEYAATSATQSIIETLLK